MSRTIADNYWWCPNCHEEVDARNVTYQECHDSCGHRVEWIENISLDRLETLMDAEREERLVEMVLKPSKSVYGIRSGKVIELFIDEIRISPHGAYYSLYTKNYVYWGKFMECDLGVKWFSDRESALAALKEKS